MLTKSSLHRLSECSDLGVLIAKPVLIRFVSQEGEIFWRHQVFKFLSPPPTIRLSSPASTMPIDSRGSDTNCKLKTTQEMSHAAKQFKTHVLAEQKEGTHKKST